MYVRSEIIFLIAPYIPSLFGITNSFVAKEAVNAIKSMSFSYIFFSIIFLFTSQYLIVRKILLANIISISSHFIFILIFCNILIMFFGISGLWLSFPLSRKNINKVILELEKYLHDHDENKNLNPYIVKNLDKNFAKSQYLVTSSFNRYIFSIPKE